MGRGGNGKRGGIGKCEKGGRTGGSKCTHLNLRRNSDRRRRRNASHRRRNSDRRRRPSGRIDTQPNSAGDPHALRVDPLNARACCRGATINDAKKRTDHTLIKKEQKCKITYINSNLLIHPNLRNIKRAFQQNTNNENNNVPGAKGVRAARE